MEESDKKRKVLCGTNRFNKIIAALMEECKCSEKVAIRAAYDEFEKTSTTCSLQDFLRNVFTRCSSSDRIEDKNNAEMFSRRLIDEIEFQTELSSEKIRLPDFTLLNSSEQRNFSSADFKQFKKYCPTTWLDSILNKSQEEWKTMSDFLPSLKKTNILFMTIVSQLIVVNVSANILISILTCSSFCGLIVYTSKYYYSQTILIRLDSCKRLFDYLAPESEDGIIKDVIGFRADIIGSSYFSFLTCLIMFICMFSFSSNVPFNINIPFMISLIYSIATFILTAVNNNRSLTTGVMLYYAACCPIFVAQFFNIPFLKLITKEIVSVKFNFVALHFSLPSIILTCLVFGLIIFYFVNSKETFWKNFANVTVEMTWWHLLILFSDRALSNPNIPSFLLSSCTIAVLLFPITSIIVLLSGLFLWSFCSLGTLNFIMQMFMTTMGTLLVVICAELLKPTDLGFARKYWMRLLAVVLLAVVILSFGYQDKSRTEDSMLTDLTWAEFNKYCSDNEEIFDNRLSSQILCSDLKGATVDWKGTVQSVKIVRIENFVDNMLRYLPNCEWVAWLRCIFGTTVDERNVVHKKLSYRNCTVSLYNVYTFEVEVAGPWGQHMISSAKTSIKLIADNSFKDILFELRESDVVAFTATLRDYLFKHSSKLNLMSISCISCRSASATSAKPVRKTEKTFWSKLASSIHSLLLFIVSPLNL